MEVSYADLQKPWLSIIIPVYNAEKYLKPCLNSILKQRFSNYEVILVDDGSTDSSAEICKSYSSADKRFHYIKKENGGPFQARIYGCEQARGTYITFCDADDYYSNKEAFSIIYEELKNEEFSALQFQNIKKYNHLKRRNRALKTALTVNKETFFSQEYPKLLCSFWDAAHLNSSLWNKVYHHKLFTNLPKSNDVGRIFWGDDMILNLHLLSTCDSFRFLPNNLYCYRELSGGTKRFSKTVMRDLDNIKKFQLIFLEKYQGKNKEIMRSILFSEVAGWFFVQIQQALEFLKEDEIIEMIHETLELDRFKIARKFYIENEQENWEAANLLRKGDAQEYIKKAHEKVAKRSIKNTMVDILRRIYTTI